MDDEKEPTYLDQRELEALDGNHDAIVSVVEALREYRKAVSNVLRARYRDGFIDGVASFVLFLKAEEIEAGPSTDDDVPYSRR